MSVVWAMTSPESGRFSPSERCSEVRELTDRFGELRSHGQGYLEVRLLGSEFPQLTLGFRDDHAVIHLINADGGMCLLMGDGTVPSDSVVEVPIADDLAEFTGGFVLGTDHAWDLVRNFVRTGAPGDLGEWCEL